MTTATVPAVRERPILFSGPMVRAILVGRKTQTRRVVTRENSEFGAWGAGFWRSADLSAAWVDGRGSGSEYLKVPVSEEAVKRDPLLDGIVDRLRCRMAPARCWDQTPDPEDGYVPPASQLWVRETFFDHGNFGIDALDGIETARDERVEYRATPWDRKGDPEDAGGWSPSIHMPRWATRLTLTIDSVRVERVQSITEADAIAEGCDMTAPRGVSDPADWLSPREQYRNLWDSLNAKRGYGWDVNPWVWCLSFRTVTP